MRTGVGRPVLPASRCPTSSRSLSHMPTSAAADIPANTCSSRPHSASEVASLPSRSPSAASFISQSTSADAYFKSARPRRPQVLTSFRLKLIWAFQDKKKFDSVIEQLDFLLSNLEKISETLQCRREMAKNLKHNLVYSDQSNNQQPRGCQFSPSICESSLTPDPHN